MCIVYSFSYLWSHSRHRRLKHFEFGWGTVAVRRALSSRRGGMLEGGTVWYLRECTKLEKVRMAVRLQAANQHLPFVIWLHYKACTFISCHLLSSFSWLQVAKCQAFSGLLKNSHAPPKPQGLGRQHMPPRLPSSMVENKIG